MAPFHTTKESSSPLIQPGKAYINKRGRILRALRENNGLPNRHALFDTPAIEYPVYYDNTGRCLSSTDIGDAIERVFKIVPGGVYKTYNDKIVYFAPIEKDDSTNPVVELYHEGVPFGYFNRHNGVYQPGVGLYPMTTDCARYFKKAMELSIDAELWLHAQLDSVKKYFPRFINEDGHIIDWEYGYGTGMQVFSIKAGETYLYCGRHVVRSDEPSTFKHGGKLELVICKDHKQPSTYGPFLLNGVHTFNEAKLTRKIKEPQVVFDETKEHVTPRGHIAGPTGAYFTMSQQLAAARKRYTGHSLIEMRVTNPVTGEFRTLVYNAVTGYEVDNPQDTSNRLLRGYVKGKMLHLGIWTTKEGNKVEWSSGNCANQHGNVLLRRLGETASTYYTVTGFALNTVTNHDIDFSKGFEKPTPKPAAPVVKEADSAIRLKQGGRYLAKNGRVLEWRSNDGKCSLTDADDTQQAPIDYWILDGRVADSLHSADWDIFCEYEEGMLRKGKSYICEAGLRVTWPFGSRIDKNGFVDLAVECPCNWLPYEELVVKYSVRSRAAASMPKHFNICGEWTAKHQLAQTVWRNVHSLYGSPKKLIAKLIKSVLSDKNTKITLDNFNEINALIDGGAVQCALDVVNLRKEKADLEKQLNDSKSAFHELAGGRAKELEQHNKMYRELREQASDRLAKIIDLEAALSMNGVKASSMEAGLREELMSLQAKLESSKKYADTLFHERNSLANALSKRLDTRELVFEQALESKNPLRRLGLYLLGKLVRST